MNNRREFLKSLARLTLFSGLTLGLGRLAMPRSEGSADRSDERCRSNGVCRKCPLVKKCGHPTARSFREASE